MTDPIVEMKGLTKKYPGVVALHNVSFDIRRGEVHGLCGENGAGKSTLIKILYGAEHPDSGEVLIEGRKAAIKSPADGVKHGISVVNQELKLAEHLFVGENIFLGHLPCRNIMGFHFINRKRLFSDAEALLQKLNVKLDVYEAVQELSVAKKQIVEIAKALSYHSQILIMDEPSASLTENELEALFKVIALLKQEGVTILYISHRLEEIFRITDRVTVLRDGQYVATHNTKDTTREQLISLMVGRKLGSEYPKKEHTVGKARLNVERLNTYAIKDISFEARQGEILGIAGLVGAGRTELARAVFGADPLQSGRVLVDGEPVKIAGVSDAIRQRIALIPEDRKNQGTVLAMAIRENVTMVNIHEYIRRFFISKKKERKSVQKYVDLLRIKTPDIEAPVSSLSGGNQQKVVLAKWLDTNSNIIIFDEPTRGIDVGAKVEIYHLMNNLARQGKTILMISSELPEIIGMCDRVIVMHGGEIAGILNREELTQERILELAI